MTLPRLAAWRADRVEYRHGTASCQRKLFDAYLPPGTYIEIRCPKCGRMHVISVPLISLNGTGHVIVDTSPDI